MFVLPISGVPVRFRTPEGHDELLLAEAPSSAASAIEMRVEAARRLAPPVDSARDWSELPFGDVDAALLALRQQTSGDRLVAEMRCPACTAWCDILLSIGAYLAANRPRRVPGVDAQPNGWYAWKGSRFRVPAVTSVLDSLKAAPADQPRLLLRSCLGADSPEVAVEASRRIETRIASVLERIAPLLSGEVQGTCPHCAKEVRGWFDPGAFVLSELQGRASLIFEHVHLLAGAYGWSEDAILALPSRRRAAYASRIQQEQVP